MLFTSELLFQDNLTCTYFDFRFDHEVHRFNVDNSIVKAEDDRIDSFRNLVIETKKYP